MRIILKAKLLEAENPHLQAEYERICSSCNLSLEPGAKHGGYALPKLLRSANGGGCSIYESSGQEV